MGETTQPNQSTAGANAPDSPDSPYMVAPRRGRATHWRRDVGLPFLLGLLAVAGWAGALALALNAPTTAPSSIVWWLIRAAQGALLALPLLIVIVGVPRARAFWRETYPGLWGAPVRAVVAVVVIVIGLTPAFFAVAPQPAVASGNQLGNLLFAAPGFSLGVGLGFTWGAHIRSEFSGVVVGWLGSLGFSAPLTTLGVIGMVMAQQQINQCQSAGYGCTVGAVLEQAAAFVFIISPLLIGLVGIVGAAIGAFLSDE